MNANFDPTHRPIKLFRNPKSGHCHRVELMMALLALPYENIDLDMANGAHKAPSFLAKNPFGQVPVIDNNGTVLSDSNAIIVYLANRYGDTPEWIGRSAHEQAQIQRWLSIAAGEIASGPAAARLVTVFGASLDHEAARSKAHRLLDIMNTMLEGKDYLACDRLTLADVSTYTYVAHAPEGGVSLSTYPNVRHWLATVQAEPRFVAMASSPIPDDGK
jgi:glutathione S-transferase